MSRRIITNTRDLARTERITKVWVDPSRDFHVVRYEQTRGGQVARQMTIELQQVDRIGWFPATWNALLFGPAPGSDEWELKQQCTGRIESVELLDEAPDDSVFEIDFPPGTRVTDAIAGRKYWIGADGEPTDVNPHASDPTTDQDAASPVAEAESRRPLLVLAAVTLALLAAAFAASRVRRTK